MRIDPVALTQDLVRLDTVNPPGNESFAIDLLAGLLGTAGFRLARQDFAPGRANLVATFGPEARPIAFTGHVDTVPLGDAPWSRPPHGAVIEDGRLYGRGASDMKGGVAAAVAAAVDLAERGALRHGIALFITAGEEIGSEGARHMVRAALPSPSALIVAEPTANRVGHGHKGALFLRAEASGRTAHSSMPQEGDNALYKVARAMLAIEAFRFDEAPHPVLGAPTVSVNLAKGGHAQNAVPAAAFFVMDVRSIPGQDHADVARRLGAACGPTIRLEVMHDLPAVWTAPDAPFAAAVAEVVAKRTGGNVPPLGMPYFTDASVLTPHLGCPTLILGPGEPTQAHKTDEWCEVDRIREAAGLYVALAEAWDAR